MFSRWPYSSLLVVKAHRDLRANRVRPVLRALRGRPALPEWRERKASVSQGRKDQKGSKDLPVRKALKEIRDCPGLVCTS